MVPNKHTKDLDGGSQGRPRTYVSPPACVAGVTGGNLKRRIEQIMDARDVRGLSFAKKAALTIAGAAVLMAPVLVGIANAPAILAQLASGVPQWQAAAGGHMAFEVASVKLLKPGSRGRAPNFALDNGDGFRTDSGENPHGRLSVTFPVPGLHFVRVQALADAGSEAGDVSPSA